MANIFAGMGGGSQSGKLTFKSLLPGTGISITQNASCIILQSTVPISATTAINNCQMVWGCGTGITSSSSFILNDTANQNTVNGFGSIRSVYNTSYSSKVNTNSKDNQSLVVGGCCNTILSTVGKSCGSVISGGSYNCINSSYRSSIIGGVSNLIYGKNFDSSMIGGISNCITGYYSYNSSYNLSIGGCMNTICNGSYINASRFNLISGLNNTIFNSGDVYHGCNYFNSISGGKCNLLRLYHANCFNSIMSSYCSCISSRCGLNGEDQTPMSNFNSILGGSCNCITKCCTFTTSSKGYNSIVGGCNNRISICRSASTFNSIVSGCNNRISNTYTETYATKNQIISGVCSIISGPVLHSSIISSNRSTIDTQSTGISYGTIIGGRYNSISGVLVPIGTLKYSSIIGAQCSYLKSSYSSIIGGYKNCSLTNQICRVIGGTPRSTCFTTAIIGGRQNTACFNGTASTNLMTCPHFSSIIGGEYNCSSFLSIGGYCNSNFAHSINISGSYNKSSLSSQSGLTPGFYIYGDNPGSDLYHEQSSVTIGGCCNISNGNISTVLSGGFCNKIVNNNASAIIGGRQNSILSRGTYAKVGVFHYTTEPSNYNSIILGGCFNRVCGDYYTDKFTSKARLNAIIGGCCNKLCDSISTNILSSIFGGQNISFCGLGASGVMATQCLLVVGAISTDYRPGLPGNVICCGWTGNCTNPTSIRIVNGLVVNVT